ncbi:PLASMODESMATA CALLOSE-BINDING PROTEIN 3-like isoform X2 [Salvia miltiorrhiza]|uniref:PLASMODESMATA CALLOSE-BINDING PROTEIN 3-like isoform X2 n=1 Tax=Salvia miltiorrhiza TaxID=226208 RepID=UPI0025ABC6E0|nr:PLASMODESMATA CALLOSE-BINDING PROTEIN 3-like isoform X2 [Salvia miltiorrhiza]
MDTAASNKFLFIFLLSYIFMVCSSGSFLSVYKGRRELIQTTQHDTINPPFTTSPVTNPVTTPATYPPDASAPPLVTVPSANPVLPPAIFPVSPAFPNPPIQAGGGAAAGQSWCVARSGVPETVLQVALDYACGMGGADCSGIQQGAACYNPTTLQNHASYAFNAYYQKNPLPTSCDFGGAAVLTNANPSSGSCVFPTSSSASPATVSPTTTTTTPAMPAPATDFSSGAGTGTPPTVLNASNPALGGDIGGFAETPPTAGISSASATTAAFISCIILPLSTILHARL